MLWCVCVLLVFCVVCVRLGLITRHSYPLSDTGVNKITDPKKMLLKPLFTIKHENDNCC